jgi:hypothetical protein
VPLPFLKPKSIAGVILSKRKPDGGQETTGMEGVEDPGLMACAEDLIRAMHAKDAQHVALALRAAFDLLDAQPHDEGEHTNETPDTEDTE